MTSPHLVVLVLLALPLASAPAAATTAPTRFPPIPGWTLTADSAHYTPDNLWDFIDGAADLFLSYGFRDLYVAEYLSGDSTDVRVEVYRHSSASYAFGMYAQERKPDYHFIRIATEGYLEERVLNFLAGCYYVKLSSHRKGATAERALKEIAPAIVRWLHQEHAWPAPLGLFPRRARVRYGEGFVAENFLGYAFFKDAYTVQYRDGGIFQLFLLDCGTADSARNVIRHYRATIGGAGPDERVERAELLVNDPNNGPVALGRKGRFLYGVSECRDPQVRSRYLRLLGQRVPGGSS